MEPTEQDSCWDADKWQPMHGTRETNPLRAAFVLTLALLALAAFYYALASLPTWFAIDDAAGRPEQAVLPAFSTPTAVAILFLTFPVAQYLGILGLRASFALNESFSEAGLSENKNGGVLVVIALLASVGLQVLLMLIYFGGLGWFPVLLILIGVFITLAGGLR